MSGPYRNLPLEEMRRESISFGLVFLLLSIRTLIMAAAKEIEGNSDGGVSSVHIVYTEKPEGEPEAYHLKILGSVLGSEAAAKEALLYSYKTAASGFSAKLTPEQVSEISKQPGVLQVTPSRTLHLHSGADHLS